MEISYSPSTKKPIQHIKLKTYLSNYPQYTHNISKQKIMKYKPPFKKKKRLYSILKFKIRNKHLL